MKSLRTLIPSAMLALFVCAAAVLAADPAPKPATAADTTTDTAAVTANDSLHYVVYYFYTNVRCATCRKLEAYSQEAVDSGFVKLISDHCLEFRGVNTDDEANAHFLKDYELYTKSVVVVAYDQDKQVRWKNLDKIWELVGDKPKFLAYIRSEVDAFMAGKEK